MPHNGRQSNRAKIFIHDHLARTIKASLLGRECPQMGDGPRKLIRHPDIVLITKSKEGRFFRGSMQE
jgi:hypothetical protein